MLGNPEIAELTSSNEIDFSELRKNKVVCYVLVKETQVGFYAFLLSLFYSQLFEFIMKKCDEKAPPIYLLLDEFSQYRIGNFETICTTVRKYRTSVSIILQSLSQLEATY